MIGTNPRNISAIPGAQDSVVAGPGHDVGTLAAEPECAQEAQYRAIVAAAEDKKCFFRCCVQAG
jgi:transposase